MSAYFAVIIHNFYYVTEQAYHTLLSCASGLSLALYQVPKSINSGCTMVFLTLGVWDSKEVWLRCLAQASDWVSVRVCLHCGLRLHIP